MTLKEIAERFEKLAIYEQRRLSDNYNELVFYSKESDKWQEVLSGILGPAVKPVGAKPSSASLALTKDYGGIHSDQTLFKGEFGSVTVVAMLWPWQDATHTTLKIILLEG